MLSILWLLLRILLFMVLGVLGLVILLVLLVLFVPFVYEGRAEKEVEQSLKEMKAEVALSWLFHGLSVRLRYCEKEMSGEFRVLGFPVKRLFQKDEGREEKDALSPKTQRDKKTIEEKEESSEELKETTKTESERTWKEMRSAESSDGSKSTEVLKSTTSVASSDKIDTIEAPDSAVPSDQMEISKKSKPSLFKRLSEKLVDLKKKYKKTVRSLSWWKRFLTHKRTKAALVLVLDKGKRLLRHLLPRRLRGRVRFALEDPAAMGTILAVAGATLPLHKNRIQLQPEFTGEKLLEASVSLCGRICLFVVLVLALQLYFNRNTKFVLRRWKHREVKHGE